MYDRSCIAARAAAAIRAQPRIPIAGVSASLRIDPHTVTRAIKEVLGMTPRALRSQCLREAVLSVYRMQPTSSLKEAAGALGYTPSAFVRLNRQLFSMTPHDVRAEALRLDSVFETDK